MILLLRQYLLTLVVLVAGLMWGLQLTQLLGWCVIAGALDFFVTRRSPELALYQRGLDLDSSVSQGLGRSRALGLQAAAALASGAIPLIALALGGPDTNRRLAGMLALTVGAGAASYCGFRAVRVWDSPRELFASLDYVPTAASPLIAPLALLEFAKQPVRRVLIAIIRIGVAAPVMVLFLIVLGRLTSGDVQLWIVFGVLFLSVMFQVGMVVITQTLFLFRWIKSMGN